MSEKQFNPHDYKPHEELLEDKKGDFVPVEGGFIKKEAAEEDVEMKKIIKSEKAKDYTEAHEILQFDPDIQESFLLHKKIDEAIKEVLNFREKHNRSKYSVILPPEIEKEVDRKWTEIDVLKNKLIEENKKLDLTEIKNTTDIRGQHKIIEYWKANNLIYTMNLGSISYKKSNWGIDKYNYRLGEEIATTVEEYVEKKVILTKNSHLLPKEAIIGKYNPIKDEKYFNTGYPVWDIEWYKIVAPDIRVRGEFNSLDKLEDGSIVEGELKVRNKELELWVKVPGVRIIEKEWMDVNSDLKREELRREGAVMSYYAGVVKKKDEDLKQHEGKCDAKVIQHTRGRWRGQTFFEVINNH